MNRFRENFTSRLISRSFSFPGNEKLRSETDWGYNPKRQISNRTGLIGPDHFLAKFLDFRPFFEDFPENGTLVRIPFLGLADI